MSTSIRFSIDAPGSGHKGSVDCDNATGRSHWKPLSTNLLVRLLRVYVMILPMQAFLSVSVSESWSKGLGNSRSWTVFWVDFKIVHLDTGCSNE